MTETSRLHLPDLTIKGFRGIDELSIPRLGRVTLLAGRNSVGKTTVLDAVRVYAARGRYDALRSLLEDREEMTVATNEDGDNSLLPDLEALFHGRDVSQSACISIGTKDVADRLTITTTALSDEQTDYHDPISDFVPAEAVKAVYRSNEQVLPWTFLLNDYSTHLGHSPAIVRRALRRFNKEEPPPSINCESLGPALLNNDNLSIYWDNVALTDEKSAVLEALRMAFDRDIDDVAMIGDEQVIGKKVGRRAMVKLKGDSGPVPLRSLGDGALRLFGVALALANSRAGYLLIDEAENGVHHSVQRDYWRMILQTAQENNVQVLATTHSWDCVTGFAQAASELEDVEGVLVRLSRSGGDLRAVEYPEEELAIAAEQGIEVR